MTLRLPGVPGYAAALDALASHAFDVGDLVHVTEYVTGAPPDRSPLGGHPVPVSTVRVAALPGVEGGTLVELTAHPGGGEPVRTRDAVARIADDTVYLPSLRPRTNGDFREQYRDCLLQAADLLAAAGLRPGALVRTTDYTETATRADYPRCGRPRRELLGGTDRDGAPVFPASAGILVDGLDSRVSLDALASRAPLKTVNPGWERYDTLTYRPGVLAGRTLFMSGFAALEPVTQRALFPGDLAAQADFTYANVQTVLRQVPGAEIVSLVEYATPEAVPALAALAPLREKYFGPVPAVTTVVCSALLRPEFLLEVVPTAVLR
ncbi:RidA family protein [Actinocorallia longicatena]|uniref:Enamine deaminase RidA (YjgF/YER057c/UK114 family) n=1 Tax=Actinocorallia longicatena TaxID=111803 RepID=A0ABP6Q3R3_9ACTN